MRALREEVEVWRKMMILKGIEKSWIHSLAKDDREDTKARYNLVGGNAGHVGIAVQKTIDERV